MCAVDSGDRANEGLLPATGRGRAGELESGLVPQSRRERALLDPRQQLRRRDTIGVARCRSSTQKEFRFKRKRQR